MAEKFKIKKGDQVVVTTGRDKGKKGKAAWSKLEDVLAERRLKKELEDFEDDL